MRLTEVVCRTVSRFVPASENVSQTQIKQLQDFLTRSERLFVLTGAGFSTESGIPDYRSEGVGLYNRTDRRPMQFQEFLKSPHARQRYWARNYVGWPQFSSTVPNSGHRLLSDWENQGILSHLVTQNVDALHTKAGNKKVIELHGCSHRVVCLGCKETLSRQSLQTTFENLNPTFTADCVDVAPDGDVQLSDDQVNHFKVPDCSNCGGILKPDVIFFGDNVPRPTVNTVFDLVEECDSLLVAGSSLHVYSGYRFVRRASELQKSIAILNIGETRADVLAHVKINANCSTVLTQIQLT